MNIAKKIQNHIHIVPFLVALLVLFTGCSSPKAMSQETALPAPAVYEMDLANEEYGGDLAGAGSAKTGPIVEEKISCYANLEYETTSFEKTCEDLKKLPSMMNGKILNASESRSSQTQRYANYQFAIPASEYQSFMDTADKVDTLVYKNEGSDNLTTQYIDIESRLASLQAQQARLNELAEKAETVEDLISIEDKLYSVQYEIENYISSQKYLNEQIDYSTITISVYEVHALSSSPSSSFPDKLASAFKNSFINFSQQTEQFVLWIVYNLPFILLICVVFFILFLLVRKYRRQNKALAKSNSLNDKDSPIKKEEESNHTHNS